MNKLAIADLLHHRLEQLLVGDAESCEYRARVLEALARGIKAYYSALSILPSHLSPPAGVSPSFSPAVDSVLTTQGDTNPAAGVPPSPVAGAFLHVEEVKL